MRWNFPDDIAHALQHYAQPQLEEAGHLGRLTHLAARIAFAVGDGIPAADIAATLDPALARSCGLEPGQLVDDIARCADQAASGDIGL